MVPPHPTRTDVKIHAQSVGPICPALIAIHQSLFKIGILHNYKSVNKSKLLAEDGRVSIPVTGELVYL